MNHPDGNLVAASRRGDRQAYAELVHRHLRRVFAICLSILGGRAEAEDASQEAFVRGFERINSLRDGERFASWVDMIARNHCRDSLRRRQRRPVLPMSDAVERMAVTATDEFDDLHQALTRLSEDHRLPLLLYYYDGKDTRTLARELGLSVGGACARLHRARRQLRRLLEEKEPSHE